MADSESCFPRMGTKSTINAASPRPYSNNGENRNSLPPPSPPPKPETKILSLLLKTIIMLFVTSLFFFFLGLATALLLLHLCLAGVFHHGRNRRGNAVQFPVSSSGFSSADLRELSQFRFSKWVRPEWQTECIVCLDEFTDGQWCRKLRPCGHIFHRKCLDSWLIKVSACPICRTRVRFISGDTNSELAEEEEANKRGGI